MNSDGACAPDRGTSSQDTRLLDVLELLELLNSSPHPLKPAPPEHPARSLAEDIFQAE